MAHDRRDRTAHENERRKEEQRGKERVRKAVQKLNETAKRTWPPPVTFYDKWCSK